MSISFGLVDPKVIERLRQQQSDKSKVVLKELANAVNKAARELVNEARSEWDATLTATGYAKDRLDIVVGATQASLEAKIAARERATRADRFNYRAGTGGVHLNVRRGRAGATLKNAFIIPNAKYSGGALILERLQKYQKGEGRNFKGGKFKAVYSPSVNQFFYDARVRLAPQALSEAKKQFLAAIK